MSDCIEWTGARFKTGYGMVSGRGKPRRAHRVAYEEAYGPIPDGLFVLHSCDNRICINPEHLHLGTNADNMREMSERKRSRWEGIGGSAHPASKLTETIVSEIKKRLRQGETMAALAREFGFTHAGIRSIKIGRTWSHVK